MPAQQAIVGVLLGFFLACSSAPRGESGDASVRAFDSDVPDDAHDGARRPLKPRDDAGSVSYPVMTDATTTTAPSVDSSIATRGFVGRWRVSRASDSPCLDGQGAPRERDADGEVWSVTPEAVDDSGLGRFTVVHLGDDVLKLERPRTTGSVTLTSADSFAGTLAIRGQSPIPYTDGWTDCVTHQTVRGVRL